MKRWLFVPLAVAVVSWVAVAVPPDAEKAAKATAVEVGDAAKRAQVEKGLTVTAWASEPALANPVSFAFDGQGACYVVETNRFNEGTPDTRSFMHWLDEDIGSRSVEDRLAMYAKHKYPAYEKFGETVRKLVDTTGKGVADTSTLFAGPFNKPADGVAAGVLARDGDVYVTCIPSLYKLKDTKGTGTADVTDVMSTGYGVRVQFVGHDLHGLRMGPDGKLYFSIGDRGFKVVTKEGTTLSNPDSGAVLRCLPDGSKLEIVHVGLRNPQELAFDELGNLFTYDNNSDSGDKARWVQIVEGGDSGWRCGYQYGTLMHNAGVPEGNRGPWNSEGIWHTETKDSKPPAYVVPPLAHFGNGPSGLTYYPGVGLGDRYKGHFFACDFTASASNSVIWSLAVKPKGASFEVTDLHPFVKNMVATDCEFGPDGNFYWLDWVGGWTKPQKGRIFKVTDAEAMKNPAVAEAKKLLAEGFAKKSPAELIALFDHPHRELRQEAQFALAKRPEAGELLKQSKPTSVLAKLHTIWALGQLNLNEAASQYVVDPSPDVRRNAHKIYSQSVFLPRFITSPDLLPPLVWSYQTEPGLVQPLADADLAVRAEAIRSFAKLAVRSQGKLKPNDPNFQASQYAPIFTVLKDNDNRDAYLRQAAVEALITLAGPAPCELANAWKASKPASDHPAIRLGVVLALRKLQCPKLDEWLGDSDPAVAAEAARAIYDQALPTPMPGLAKLSDNPGLQDAVAYRALAANYRLGEAVHANRVAAVAARSSENEGVRMAALKMLEEWAKPKRLDPITGLTMNLGERSPEIAKHAAVGVLAKLFVGSDSLRKQSAQLTAKLGIQEVGPLMLELIADAKQPVNTRVEALFALEAVKATQLAEAAKLALASGEAKLRGAARVVNAKSNPTAALTELPALLKDDQASLVEKQMALAVMGTLKESADIDGAILGGLTDVLAGKLPIALKLDVMEAAQARSTTDKLKLHAPLREKLKEIDTADRAAVAKDPLARDRLASAGGDAAVGRQIFLNNAAVYCQRCHKLDGQGGEVGPALNDIAKTKDRDYLLESIVNPNAKIAEGYQSVILNLADGRTLSGVLRGKDAKTVTLVTAENKTILVPRDEIDAEKPDKSAMPDDLHKKLSKRELRDVVEFLASLK